MIEASNLETQQFVTLLREAVEEAIASVRRRTFSTNEEVLLSPASVTAGLVLSAADFCVGRGMSMSDFTSMLNVFVSDLEKVHKSEPDITNV